MHANEESPIPTSHRSAAHTVSRILARWRGGRRLEAGVLSFAADLLDRAANADLERDPGWLVITERDVRAIDRTAVRFCPVAEERFVGTRAPAGHPAALLMPPAAPEAVLSLPLATSHGITVGLLVVSVFAGEAPDEADLAVLRDLLAAVLAERYLVGVDEQRQKLDWLLTGSLLRFVDIPIDRLDGAVAETISDIGRATGADRAYLYLLDRAGSTLSNTHEWCRHGIASMRDSNQKLPLAAYPWLVSKLLGQEAIFLRNVDELPESAHRERRAFITGSRKTVVAVPLSSSRRVIGFIGLDAVRSSRHWSDEVVALLKVLGHIIGSAFERCWDAEDLERQREQILEREAQLRLAFDTARIGMATATVDGRLLTINHALAKLTGYTEEELRERAWVSLLAPDEQLRAQCALAELVRGDRTRLMLESRYLRSDGRAIDVSQHIGLVTDSRGHPHSLLIEVEDLADRKRVEAELIRASKFESLGLLAGGIAHDFNNILTAVMGSISVCLSRLPATEGVTERLQDVEKAVLRARDLTQQLLTFSKGGAPVRKPSSLVEILRDTVGFTVSGTRCRFTIEAPDALWAVRVDPGQISQVINNLVLNAAQAMPEGGVVAVTCANVTLGKSDQAIVPLAAGRYVRVDVCDDGCGISREHLSQIFDPFFTTKDAGTGLGLATVYSIVKKHGGHIEVESEVGLGTTFTVYLPASRLPAQPSLRDQVEIVPGSGRILLVDDEDLVRRTAESMLVHLGYTVECAEDGVRAIELYREAMRRGDRFDAVIMDLTIPGSLGGDAALRKLRKIDPSVRAIVSSGYSDGPVVAEYRRYGFQGVMAKPYELRQLSSVLHQVLDTKV